MMMIERLLTITHPICCQIRRAVSSAFVTSSIAVAIEMWFVLILIVTLFLAVLSEFGTSL
ncbi:hypothetical protein A4G99_12550 [Haladaptatus sp. R4]|nr:hypothetical protein A4G99_12550 [Haladaptatus sp. R4]